MTLAVNIAQGGSNNVTMDDFRPTALLVMEHNVTGKKYFCKTNRIKRVHTYKGSGLHWKRHLKKHGNDITVGVVGFYVDEDRCVDRALSFSAENNIVESDAWLNYIVEDGLTGWASGKNNYAYGNFNQYKGKKRPDISAFMSGELNPCRGKPSPLRGRKNLGASLAHKGRKRPEGGGKKPHAVIRIDVDGVETRYDSVADAARAIGMSRSTVHRVCTGKTKTGAGYKWRYAND